MKLYFLNARYEPKNGDPRLEGLHKWIVPSIACPKCGLRMRFTDSYPGVDLSSIEDRIPGRPLKPTEFQTLEPELRELIPAHLPVFSSQSLGPLKAKIFGIAGDVIPLVGYGTTCIQRSALVRLQDGGIDGLDAYPVIITGRKRLPVPEIMEFQVNGFVHLASPSYPKDGLRLCSICQRDNLRQLLSESVTVKKSSIPSHGHVFGLWEWAKGSIVTERFKEVGERVLDNAVFKEIPVIDE